MSKKTSNWYHLTSEEIKIVEKLRQGLTDLDQHRLRIEKNDAQAKYKKLLEEFNLAEQRFDIMMKLQQQQSDGVFSYKPKKKNDEDEAVACMIGSDWHIEENVDKSTVNGLNEYNLDIAKARVQNFFQNGLRLINHMRHGVKIDTVILAILGDVISGYIHEELQEDNNLSPVQAVLYAKDLITNGIDFLLQNGKIENLIIPTSIGNHGRTTIKKRISSSYKNSYEWLMYNILKSHYEKDKRVHIIVSNSYHTWVKLFDKYDIRFHHGDSMIYKGGIGGITIPVNKAISQWNKTKPAYLDVFGHFHQFFDGGNFICNGSVIGYSPFAISIKASYEIPKQAFFLIDRDRGKTIVAPIFVE